MTHLKPRSTTVALYQGDDMDRLAHLQRAVAVAERRLAALESDAEQSDGVARAGDDTSDEITAARAAVGAARDAFDSSVDDAAGRALSVELHSIGRRRFADLLVAHPPRMVSQKIPRERVMGEVEPEMVESVEEVEHPDDVTWGVNTETFPRALLVHRDGNLVTIARPEFSDDAAVAAFVDDELAEGDFEQLWIAAWSLNRSPSADPKAVRYSAEPSLSLTGI